MLDLNKYASIGEALREALETFPAEVCLFESDRGEEKERLTYRDFKARALPFAKALQESGFSAGDCASIIMTNQPKWLISAYAVLYDGGTLVPLDYKLKPEEQWHLLKHSGASVLITEYGIWRQLSYNRLSERDLSANKLLRNSAVAMDRAGTDPEVAGKAMVILLCKLYGYESSCAQNLSAEIVSNMDDVPAEVREILSGSTA